jgi:uncharacterized oligopeptide transporter (OPT) family protein
VAVVATGFVLGGSLGVGTVLYALSIGPLAQLFLRVFAIPGADPADRTVAPAPESGTTSVTAPSPEEAILPQ